MPPVIVAAGLALQSIGIAAATVLGGVAAGASIGIGAAVALGAAVVVGGALVARQAMSLFEVDMPAVDTDTSRQRTVKSTTEPQKIIYGEALVSGPISFVGLAGTNNEDFYQAIVLAGHKLNNITDIHMDDLVIPNADINSGNAAGGQVGGSGPFGFKNSSAICTINKHQGDASQTADSLLTPLPNYTTSHRGDGIAYLAMKWTLNEHSAKTWEKYSPQNVKALVQGKSIYDPRLDVAAGNDAGDNPINASYIAYSTNPALCVADYLMDATLGMGISAAKIDWAAIITAADGCDVEVDVPGATGAKEKRFTCNGVIFATDKHQKNINKILSSMNGNLVYSNGKYILHAGIYEAETVQNPYESLNEDDLIGAISIKTSLERSDRFNTIKGLFVDPSQNHKSSEFPKVQLADAVNRDNGEVLEKEVQYPMTNSSYGAQRLSHKLIQLSDQQKIITFPANLSALRIAAGDRVKVTVEELSWTNKVFQCVDWTFSEQGGVNLTLREDSSTSYADPVISAYSTITASGSITDAFRGVPSPSGLRAASGEGKVFLNWVNPGRPADYATIEVFSSSTNNVNNAVKIGDTDGTQFVHDGNNAADSIAVGNPRYYWIRSKKNVGTTVSEVSVYEPNSTTSSVSVTVLATAVNWDNVANPTIGVDINNDTISINTGSATTTTGQAVATSGLEAGTTVTQGGLTMNQGGSIKGGQSAYNSGTGFFLGYDSGYKFSIGNSNTQALTFDGSNLSVTGNITATSGTFTGTVNATSGAFTGDVSTGSKFTAGSSNDIAVMDGSNALYRFYAGNSVPESAAFRVDKDGHIDAANIRVYDENGQVILDATGLHGVGLGNISANSGVGVSEVAGRLDNNGDEITFTTGASSETYTFEPKVQIDINQTGESGENPNTSNLFFAAASESAVTTMIGQVKLIVEYFVKASGGSYSGTPTATEEFTFVSGTSATSSQFGVNVLTINSRGVGIIYADIGAAEAISDPSIAGARTFVRSSKNLTFSSAGTYNVKVNARIATLAGTTLTTSTTPALDSSLSGTGVILGTDETQSSLEDFRRLYAIKPASGNARTIIASSTDDTFVSTSGSSLLNTGGTISGDLVITGDLTVQGTAATINVADMTVAGSLDVTGDLNITGDINSYNVTDLDVTDKTITVNSGNTQALSDGAGLIVERGTAANASILWNETNDEFNFSHQIAPLTIRNPAGTGRVEIGTIANDQQNGYIRGSIIMSRNEDQITYNKTTDKWVHAGGGSTDWSMIAHSSGGSNFYTGPSVTSATSYTNAEFSTAYQWLHVPKDTKIANFYVRPTVTGNNIWHAGDFDNNSTNWNTAYTYSQVGHLPLTGGSITGSATNTLNLTVSDTVANQSFNAIKLDYNLSGSDTLTADRAHYGIYLDIDSSASGGDTSQEHRLYGVVSDVRASGDSDIIVGVSGSARADNFGTGNTVSNIRGVNGIANAHNDAGTLTTTSGTTSIAYNSTSGTGKASSIYGSYSLAYAASTSDQTSNLTGSYNIAQVSTTQTAAIGSITGVFSEIQLDNDTAADHSSDIGSAFVYRAYYDENDADDSYTVDYGYLFHGAYAGTRPTNAWGLYISSDVPNYFAGLVRSASGFQINSTTVIDASRNLTNIGTIASSNINTTTYVKTPHVGIGDAAYVGTSIGHTAANREGIFWHTNTDYSIARTSGAWSAPDYTQLKIDWPTGIELDGGTAYGKSGVNISAGNLQIGGTEVIDASRNLTNIGTISSGRVTSVSTIGAADDVRTGLEHDDSSPMAAGVGGQLVLGYKYTSAGTYTEGAIIKMYKENGTSGHYGSGLKFQVRNTGAALSTKMTLDPYGTLNVPGTISSGHHSITTIGTGNGLYVAGGDSTGQIKVGNYLRITGATQSNTGAISFNANYQGAQLGTWAPDYHGSTAAGMFVLRQDSGGVGSTSVWVKSSGTTGTAAALSTFTKVAQFHQDGYFSTPAGLRIGSTEVIDSSRNLKNIGTISSGAITTSGTFTGQHINLRNDTAGDGAIIRDISFLTSAAQGTDDRVAIIRASNQGGDSTNRGGKLTFYTRSSSNAGFNGALTLDKNGNAGFAGTISSGAITSTGDFSLNKADGFAYLSNVGTGNAGIYVRGIGSSGTLRSHSTTNFTWEVTGGQKMDLNSSGVLNAVGGYKVNGVNVIDSSRNLIGNSLVTPGANSYGLLRVTHPGGAERHSRTGSETGAIKITLPALYTSTMLRFTIKIYEYTTGEAFEVVVGGYNHGSSSAWLNTTAYTISDPSSDRDFKIRFGDDGTKCCVYIGETDSGWAYSQITVTDFQAGFGNATSAIWADGWDISIVTSFGTITQTHTQNEISTQHRLVKVGGTTVIDSSRNLTNIGTISSGAITASSSGAVASFNRTDNDAIIELKRSGSAKGYIGANTSGDIKFYNASASGTLTISSAGNLTNIGTISSGAITATGPVIIDVDDQADGALRIVANQTNPNQDFYFAEEIISTLSGSTATTADREQGGIYLDINSTATGGGTSHEHRVYGIYADVDSTGDADVTLGGYFNATATPTTGTTTWVIGVEGFAEDNGGAGATTTIAGVKGTAWSDNATSDANTLVGGTFKAGHSADSGAIGVSRGVIAEIEFSGTGDLSGTSYVFDAQYDNNTSVAQTHTAALYYGNYAGTLPTTAYGVFIADAVDNYFAGFVRSAQGFQIGSDTVVDSSRNGTFSLLQGTGIGVNNTASNTKKGIALYGGSGASTNPTYGLMFSGTSGSGTHGSVTADWATYFTMNSTSGRGWIFRNVSTPTNVASISNAGAATFNSSVTSSILVSNILDPGNPSAAADTLRLSGYGLMANRGTVYITNSNTSGVIQLGVGGVHNANPALTVGAAAINAHGSTFQSGAITSSGNVTAFSDERLKDDIETLDGKKVLEMRGVSFTKDGESGSGVIAQELEKVAPELVHTADDEMGTKSVAYGNLVGYLIEAVKTQQQQIEDLSSEIKKLKEK